ncbi:MAG: precorrin-2 C(20)-methyltransferase [Candidatus Tectimicrobiota bacterium]
MSGPGPGTLYGVGLGPGDPELLTRKAVRILSEVDWIFHPVEQRTGSSFSRRILETLDLPASKLRQVSFGMSQERAADLQTYAAAVDTIAREVRQGKSVAWVTLGDPLFYSTFIHLYVEMRRCCPDVPLAIVPGVPSTHAAAAAAGLPVAVLEEQVAVLPAVYSLEHLNSLLNDFATIFLIKVHTVFEQLLDLLPTLPQTVQAVYIERVGTPEERVVHDLTTLRGQRRSYFSIVMLRRNASTLVAAQQKEQV